MSHRHEVEARLNAWLTPELFKDYGPNGLQVEGAAQVQHVVSGVTASRALIDAAVDAGADTLLVHHGLFWRGQDGRVTGWLRERLARLLGHGINLLAYHLPLDAHAEMGNNAQWALRMGWHAQGRFGEQQLGFAGTLAPGQDTLAALSQSLEQQMGRPVLAVPGDGRPLTRIGWCSGGAQSYFEAAIGAGVDVFVTGEVSEPQAHLAAETGVAFIACGHHASERYGVQAVGQRLAAELGLRHTFIDLPNPA